jgi:hypothetical protein
MSYLQNRTKGEYNEIIIINENVFPSVYRNH